MRATIAATAAADGFIDRWGIHERGILPVPIIQAARWSGWSVQFIGGMWPAMGIAYMLPNLRRIQVDENLAACWQRTVIAHELGHWLADHRGIHHCVSTRVVKRSAKEMVADELAARLLVPEWAIERFPMMELATRCQVPQALVDLRIGTCDLLLY